MRIDILEESAMRVLEVEIYISDQMVMIMTDLGVTYLRALQLRPAPLNAVVEESIGHQVGNDGELVQRDVPPQPARVLVQDEVRHCSVLACC